MSITEPNAIHTPTADKALIIFEAGSLRRSLTEPASNSLWDVTDRSAAPELLGAMSPTMKVAYMADPGEHYFLSVWWGNRQLMKANVAPNRTYYVRLEVVVPWSGRPRLEFNPISKGEENPVAPENISVMLPAGENWEASSVGSARKHSIKAFVTWDQMTNEERSRFTLRPEDGR